jgi:N-formylmaleamate deformylase
MSSRRDVGERHHAELQSLGAQSRWIAEAPVRLHTLDYGGERPPLLVLPGITSPAITWDFVVAGLRDLVRPIVLDIRGRGLSDTAATYTTDDYADDAERVIAALGLERPLVLGHSMGARIAACLAARRSVELAGTILVDPPLSGPGPRGPYPTPRASFVQQLDAGYAGTNADEIQRFYPLWPRAELALRARWLSTCDERAILATYDRFTIEDLFSWWRDVPSPAVLIRGGESPVVTAAGAEELAAANPAALQRVVPAAGHMVAWDNHAGFMAEVRALLESEFDVAAASAARL